MIRRVALRRVGAYLYGVCRSITVVNNNKQTKQPNKDLIVILVLVVVNLLLLGVSYAIWWPAL